MFEESDRRLHTDSEEWATDSDSSLKIDLEITDAELLEILSRRAPGRERNEFVRAALKIGAIALEQAGSRIDTDRVRQKKENA